MHFELVPLLMNLSNFFAHECPVGQHCLLKRQFVVELSVHFQRPVACVCAGLVLGSLLCSSGPFI